MRTYCIIRVVMEAVRTPETSIYFNETTRRYVPEGSDIQNTYNLFRMEGRFEIKLVKATVKYVLK
jgi:hypothetical protein